MATLVSPQPFDKYRLDNQVASNNEVSKSLEIDGLVSIPPFDKFRWDHQKEVVIKKSELGLVTGSAFDQFRPDMRERKASFKEDTAANSATNNFYSQYPERKRDF
ncbi:hypothetical protein C1N61_30340 (plasmid) [Priestia aryabhattai]